MKKISMILLILMQSLRSNVLVKKEGKHKRMLTGGYKAPQRTFNYRIPSGTQVTRPSQYTFGVAPQQTPNYQQGIQRNFLNNQPTTYNQRNSIYTAPTPSRTFSTNQPPNTFQVNSNFTKLISNYPWKKSLTQAYFFKQMMTVNRLISESLRSHNEILDSQLQKQLQDFSNNQIDLNNHCQVSQLSGIGAIHPNSYQSPQLTNLKNTTSQLIGILARQCSQNIQKQYLRNMCSKNLMKELKLLESDMVRLRGQTYSRGVSKIITQNKFINQAKRSPSTLQINKEIGSQQTYKLLNEVLNDDILALEKVRFSPMFDKLQQFLYYIRANYQFFKSPELNVNIYNLMKTMIPLAEKTTIQNGSRTVNYKHSLQIYQPDLLQKFDQALNKLYRQSQIENLSVKKSVLTYLDLVKMQQNLLIASPTKVYEKIGRTLNEKDFQFTTKRVTLKTKIIRIRKLEDDFERVKRETSGQNSAFILEIRKLIEQLKQNQEQYSNNDQFVTVYQKLLEEIVQMMKNGKLGQLREGQTRREYQYDPNSIQKIQQTLNELNNTVKSQNIFTESQIRQIQQSQQRLQNGLQNYQQSQQVYKRTHQVNPYDQYINQNTLTINGLPYVRINGILYPKTNQMDFKRRDNIPQYKDGYEVRYLQNQNYFKVGDFFYPLSGQNYTNFQQISKVKQNIYLVDDKEFYWNNGILIPKNSQIDLNVTTQNYPMKVIPQKVITFKQDYYHPYGEYWVKMTPEEKERYQKELNRRKNIKKFQSKEYYVNNSIYYPLNYKFDPYKKPEDFVKKPSIKKYFLIPEENKNYYENEEHILVPISKGDKERLDQEEFIRANTIPVVDKYQQIKNYMIVNEVLVPEEQEIDFSTKPLKKIPESIVDYQTINVHGRQNPYVQLNDKFYPLNGLQVKEIERRKKLQKNQIFINKVPYIYHNKSLYPFDSQFNFERVDNELIPEDLNKYVSFVINGSKRYFYQKNGIYHFLPDIKRQEIDRVNQIKQNAFKGQNNQEWVSYNGIVHPIYLEIDVKDVCEDHRMPEDNEKYYEFRGQKYYKDGNKYYRFCHDEDWQKLLKNVENRQRIQQEAIKRKQEQDRKIRMIEEKNRQDEVQRQKIIEERKRIAKERELLEEMKRQQEIQRQRELEIEKQRKAEEIKMIQEQERLKKLEEEKRDQKIARLEQERLEILRLKKEQEEQQQRELMERQRREKEERERREREEAELKKQQELDRLKAEYKLKMQQELEREKQKIQQELEKQKQKELEDKQRKDEEYKLIMSEIERKKRELEEQQKEQQRIQFEEQQRKIKEAQEKERQEQQRREEEKKRKLEEQEQAILQREQDLKREKSQFKLERQKLLEKEQNLINIQPNSYYSNNDANAINSYLNNYDPQENLERYANNQFDSYGDIMNRTPEEIEFTKKQPEVMLQDIDTMINDLNNEVAHPQFSKSALKPQLNLLSQNFEKLSPEEKKNLAEPIDEFFQSIQRMNANSQDDPYNKRQLYKPEDVNNVNQKLLTLMGSQEMNPLMTQNLKNFKFNLDNIKNNNYSEAYLKHNIPVSNSMLYSKYGQGIDPILEKSNEGQSFNSMDQLQNNPNFKSKMFIDHLNKTKRILLFEVLECAECANNDYIFNGRYKL